VPSLQISLSFLGLWKVESLFSGRFKWKTECPCNPWVWTEYTQHLFFIIVLWWFFGGDRWVSLFPRNIFAVKTWNIKNYLKSYTFLQFEDENNLHKYFDVENFPYDFESDKKVESKMVTVDGKIGNCKLNCIICLHLNLLKNISISI
jgi:hypothetical protein